LRLFRLAAFSCAADGGVGIATVDIKDAPLFPPNEQEILRRNDATQTKIRKISSQTDWTDQVATRRIKQKTWKIQKKVL
jgi:hypothetical protein